MKPELAYFLGFLWGDGYINLSNNSIRIEILETDFNVLESIFDKLTHFTKFSRPSRMTSNNVHHQNQKGVTAQNIELIKFLISLDYDNKSNISHQRAIEYIPLKYQHFWLRGFFDADGCIYYNHKWNLKQFSLASSYEQDWLYLTDIFHQNKVKAKYKQKTQGKNKHSVLTGSGHINCLNLFDLLYPSRIYDFGLKRKYDKFKIIESSRVLRTTFCP